MIHIWTRMSDYTYSLAALRKHKKGRNSSRYPEFMVHMQHTNADALPGTKEFGHARNLPGSCRRFFSDVIYQCFTSAYRASERSW